MHDDPPNNASPAVGIAAASLRLALALTAVVLSGASANASPDDGIAGLRAAFTSPDPASRIMVRWWWFGPAVTDEELGRELAAMQQAGIGGVEVQPVYPVSLDDQRMGIRTEPYLSDAFLAHLRFAAVTAHALGMRFDLTLGSGWPYGGPSVAIGDAAGKLRIERVPVTPGQSRIPVPAIGAGESVFAAFFAPPPGAALESSAQSPLLRPADGAIEVTATPEARELVVFIASRTGMMVKRAAVGAEGFVVNHYDRDAVSHYLSSVGERLWQAFDADTAPTAVFCDSLEVYGSDWTPRLLEEFKRRRGYDLWPMLEALQTPDDGEAADIRHDWAETLTELLEDQFIDPLQAWATAHGTKLRAQIYGTPPASTSSATRVDLPEGEGWDWRTVRGSRWAASASHVAGRQITSAETWTWLHSPAYRATPLDIQAEANLQFLQGVNQLVGHGWPYSPPQADTPGRFYAAAALGDRNPWWPAMSDVTAALQRTSAVLRQGRPVTDVALYLPLDDAWAAMGPGRVQLNDELQRRVGAAVLPAILNAGFNVDFIDRRTLAAHGTSDGDHLAVGAARYRAVILPDVERIDRATLAALDAFARGGGAVVAVGRAPGRAPGYETRGDADAIAAASRRLFVDPGAPGHLVAAARDLGATLSRLLGPDATFEPATPDLAAVHRQAGATDIYFVANTSNLPYVTTGRFRVRTTRAEWWDPVRGTSEPLDVVAGAPDTRAVHLTLAPYASGFVVFSESAGLARRAAPHAAAGGRILLEQATVTFGDEPRAEPVRLPHNWTDSENRRYFSGVAHYDLQVTLPLLETAAGRHVVLDLGPGAAVDPTPLTNGMRAWLDPPVREAAVVYVNGRRAGAIWCAPFSLVLDATVKPGVNTIRIDVANTAVNAMAGRALPDYRLLNLRYGTRFEPQDMDEIRPVPSGLLAPVTIRWQ